MQLTFDPCRQGGDSAVGCGEAKEWAEETAESADS